MRFTVTKSKLWNFKQASRAQRKKTDADRADDKHGRFIRIKAEKVTHSAVDISEREHRVQIMRIPAVGEDVLERFGFTEQVPGFLCLRYRDHSLQGKNMPTVHYPSPLPKEWRSWITFHIGSTPERRILTSLYL